MSIKRVFKARMPSCKFIFKNGKEAHFIGGKFLTDIESEIEELEAELKSGHPHIFIDEAEKEVDSANVDPIEEIKKKAIAEYIASQQAATRKDNDRGTSEQGKLNTANSNTISEGASDSDSGAPATLVADAGIKNALANLKAGK